MSKRSIFSLVLKQLRETKKCLLILFVFTTACAPSLITPEVGSSATLTPSPSITPEATDVPRFPEGVTPTPNYLRSDAETFEAELGQLFSLRRDQAVTISSEDLTILHTTDIEFECPADADCEVPLIATDYFEVRQAGELLGIQKWDREMLFGDFVLTTAWQYSGYNYDEHQFEIILSVERQEVVAAARQTQVADPNAVVVSSDCGDGWRMAQYIAVERDAPEVHVLGIYESGRGGTVDVYVERAGVPIVLVLSAYESTEWRLNLRQGVEVQRIILNGYNPHAVVGVEDVPVIEYTGPDESIVSAVYDWPTSALGYHNGLAPAWVYQLEALVGAPLTSFTGCYRASEFTLATR